MNSIIVFGLALCLAQCFCSIYAYDKISKDEFGFSALKKEPKVNSRRHLRSTKTEVFNSMFPSSSHSPSDLKKDTSCETSSMDIRFHALQVLRRNKRAAPKSFVLFDNRSGRQIELWWKAKGRAKERYETFAAGKASIVDTYVFHQWLATDKKTKQQLLIDNKKIYTPRRNTPDTRDIVIIRRQGQNNVEIGDKYIETMVVVDRSVMEYHKNDDDVKRYVSYFLKMASQVFQHSSMSKNNGVKITMVLSKLVILREDKKEIIIKEYDALKQSGRNLDSVCDYMNKIGNNGPVKFDHKLFLTRIKFGYSGLGRRFGMCSQYGSCSLVLDVGFSTAIVIAHEVGHSLGTDDLKYGRDQKFIMAKPVTARLNNHAWSTDSKVSVLLHIKGNRCLNNKPSMDDKRFHKYPGVYYSLERQCQFEYNMNHSYWKKSEPCKELKCQLPPPYSNFFYHTKLPALDGTECGTNKWCLSGSCQTRTDSIVQEGLPVLRPVNGKWGAWKAWSPCSTNCGLGISVRNRECNNPKPRNGGRDCVGASQQPKGCRVKDCPNAAVLNADKLCSKEGVSHDRNRQWGFYDESKVNLNCDFETDTCYWKNDKLNDKQDWILKKGRTPSSNTGPSEDHTKKTQQGQYIYFESSSPTSKADKASLSSPNLAVPQACLTFWYHMYGDKAMGSLTVIKRSRGITRRLWIKTGNQGNKWLQGQVEIKDGNLYQIHFVAEKLFDGYKSDIALDSITFTSGPCRKTVQKKGIHERCSVTCTTIDNKSPKRIIHIPTNYGARQRNCKNADCDGVPGSGKRFDSCDVCGGNGQSCKTQLDPDLTPVRQENVDCDFEKGTCQWNNVRKSNNDLYWLRRRGEGYYMFVESSTNQRRGKYQAKLESPQLRILKACLSFDYRMNGRNIIKLRVRMFSYSRLLPGFRWLRKGHQGIQWQKARINIDRKSTMPYKIVIEALVRNRNHGVIAIDNIQLRKGNCG